MSSVYFMFIMGKVPMIRLCNNYEKKVKFKRYG